MKALLTINLLLLCTTQLLLAQTRDTAAIKAQTIAFEQQKGQLQCPMKYGKFDHSVIYLDENKELTRGLDIISTTDTLQAIHPGNVVFTLPDEDKTFSIIVSHGDYFTVYKKVTEAFVKPGELVEPNAVLGRCGKDKKGNYNMHFEIWRATDKLWPVHWVVCQ